MGKHRFLRASPSALRLMPCSPELEIVDWKPLENKRRFLRRCGLRLSRRETKVESLGGQILGHQKERHPQVD
eukprot:3018960-Heterocapsa_arctica.AAC.1